MNQNGFYVTKMNSKEAQEISVKNHYLHRKCPCTIAYGLYNPDNECVGVCIFGCPASSTLKRGICGDDEAFHVTELKRLWVDDKVELRFPESFFISQSLKQMRIDVPHLDIIVSYADSAYGHTGIVYQATSWIYTGMSAKFADYVEVGRSEDHLTQADEWKAKYGSAKKAREILGDKIIKVERSRKYRYVFFNTSSRKRRLELNSKLRYKRLPYPKNKDSCIANA